MKILTLVYSIGPGGTERAAVNYAVAYKQAGCESKVWVLGEGNERKPILDLHNVPIYFDVLSDHEENSLELKNWKPDIIHINSFDTRFYSVLKSFKEIGCKIVETNIFSRPRYEDHFKIVDISFQLAYWGFWKYQKWMGNRKGFPLNLRLPFVVNSSDFEASYPTGRAALRERLKIPNGAFIAARVGQSHPSKWDRNIFEVVVECTKLNDNIFFVFVGLPEKFKMDYESLPLAAKSKVRLLDVLKGDAALTEFYKSIDVFIHMSKIGESFGYVLTEAMVCGCPVVTLSTPFKDNAQFEVVGHGTGGYCATSVKDFINFILLINENSTFATKELRNNIEGRYSAKALIPSLLQVFENLIKNETKKLHELSFETYTTSKIIISEQMTLYGIRGFFIKLALEVIHTSFFYRGLKLFKK